MARPAIVLTAHSEINPSVNSRQIQTLSNLHNAKSNELPELRLSKLLLITSDILRVDHTFDQYQAAPGCTNSVNLGISLHYANASVLDSLAVNWSAARPSQREKNILCSTTPRLDRVRAWRLPRQRQSARIAAVAHPFDFVSTTRCTGFQGPGATAAIATLSLPASSKHSSLD